MNTLYPIGVPTETGRGGAPKWPEALAPAERRVAEGASGQFSEPRQRWPDLRLPRYLDTEAERRVAR